MPFSNRLLFDTLYVCYWILCAVYALCGSRCHVCVAITGRGWVGIAWWRMAVVLLCTMVTSVEPKHLHASFLRHWTLKKQFLIYVLSVSCLRVVCCSFLDDVILHLCGTSVMYVPGCVSCLCCTSEWCHVTLEWKSCHVCARMCAMSLLYK